MAHAYTRHMAFIPMLTLIECEWVKHFPATHEEDELLEEVIETFEHACNDYDVTFGQDDTAVFAPVRAVRDILYHTADRVGGKAGELLRGAVMDALDDAGVAAVAGTASRPSDVPVLVYTGMGNLGQQGE